MDKNASWIYQTETTMQTVRRMQEAIAERDARIEELEAEASTWKSIADGRSKDVETLLEIAGVDYNFVEDYQANEIKGRLLMVDEYVPEIIDLGPSPCEECAERDAEIWTLTRERNDALRASMADMGEVERLKRKLIGKGEDEITLREKLQAHKKREAALLTFVVEITCEECDGSGATRSMSPCHHCDGTGFDLSAPLRDVINLDEAREQLRENSE